MTFANIAGAFMKGVTCMFGKKKQTNTMSRREENALCIFRRGVMCIETAKLQKKESLVTKYTYMGYSLFEVAANELGFNSLAELSRDPYYKQFVEQNV